MVTALVGTRLYADIACTVYNTYFINAKSSLLPLKLNDHVRDKSVLYSDEVFENAMHFLTKVTVYAVERTPRGVIQLGRRCLTRVVQKCDKVCNKQTGQSQ